MHAAKHSSIKPWMKRPTKILPCVLSLGLMMGCNDGSTAPSDNSAKAELGTYPEECSEPKAPFRTAKDGLEHHGMVFDLKLARDNRVLLNGKEIEQSELPVVANEANDLSPAPYFVLDIESGTPCRFVSELRSNLGETALCRSGRCAEGRDPNSWPITGGP